MLLALFLFVAAVVPGCLSSPGLGFSQLTDVAAFPPRANAHVARLLAPQTYFDLASGRNVTLPSNSFLLYGGEFDCTPDVWISPAADHSDWRLMSGFTGFHDCEGPWTPSAYPMAAYSADQGRMHVDQPESGRALLLGGWSKVDATAMSQDVWYSDDHIHWRLVNASSSKQLFSPRVMGGVFAISSPKQPSSQLFMVGGLGPNTTAPGQFALLSDVWTSEDGGVTWRLLTDAAPFAARMDVMAGGLWDAAAGTFRMWVVGGMRSDEGAIGNEAVSNDVYSSQDGVKWTALPTAPFPPRARAGFHVTPDGVLLVLGGGTTVSHGGWDSWLQLDDVWASFDGGQTWLNCTSEQPSWKPRSYPSLAVDEKGYLHLIAGIEGWPSFGDADVWRSAVSVWDRDALTAACGAKAVAAADEQRSAAELSAPLRSEHARHGRLRRRVWQAGQ